MLMHSENTVASAAKFLVVSRNTIHQWIPELRGDHLAPAEALVAPELRGLRI
ncbi:MULTISPECIES: hypothetical protein [unclassified Streptomyces]|uniref:hypothetical protein n=1 Tax=unclassified Streptomyces TaxID=2593676 RepID=UPI002DD8DBA8|nr:hypothetical protein [Streptomyces sp. NBC_00243]WRZ18001.1 hypothetical protein OHT59_05640 [Streptomyces sp. NBC_00243]